MSIDHESTKKMMNDECGMMDEAKVFVFYSSFRIHHSSFLLFMVFFCCSTLPVVAQALSSTQTADAKTERTRYQIDLALDFDARTFTGVERVRWVNRDDRAASVLYFHLYANLRRHEPIGSAVKRGENESDSTSGNAIQPVQEEAVAHMPDVPHLEIKTARDIASGQMLNYSLAEQETLLRVSLREPVAADATIEIEISFAGSVPEIDPDETSLPAHVIQQLSAALRDTRETRGARDLNFRSRGIMLLGTAYPILAVRDGGDWQRESRASVGDFIHADVADYDVSINAPADVALFTSGELTSGGGNRGGDVPATRRSARHFAGENLRSFAILAGRTLQSAERAVSGVRVQSVWAAEHEKTGRRVQEQAVAAVRLFVARFGPLPFNKVSIAEAPLVAGFGSAEFSGLCVIASALYVDFDSPTVKNLPEIVQEQRASVEDSLEFTVAHMTAHQWWGATVGSAPERDPVIDEALAHWSALLYYRERHGPERAEQASDDQLRGVYEIYRTFGGEDMAADRPARDYRNSFQYAAIVAAKGALLFAELRNLLGEEKFITALRRYLEANRFEIAQREDLRAAFVAEAPIPQRRVVSRMFDRWLSERHGDEDVAPPNPQLAAALGLSMAEPSAPKDRNAFSRLGRFFWRQMTRIR
ncbi:MAG: M1 family metallopeptidase [Acidobacteriota bacterium]|nr:M1 family metallopeptidase [Acidobacteriota bacterium]